MAEGFYESGHPLLNDYSLVERLLARKREVAAVCPFAVLQAMLLQSERLLVSIYRSSAESADVHAIQFSEASQLNLEFNLVQEWLREQLRLNRSDRSELSSKWPLAKGWRRVGRYYDLLWQDVYDSQDAWSRMEGEKSVSDEEYHKFFFDVVDTFEALDAEWWPCRGTLIAFLRHGARSGSLSKKKDVVDQDIDVMLGVEDEASFDELGRSVETLLRKKGWDRCWTKSSQSAQSFETGALRRDLLYCVHTGPPYMMLDVTSYVTLSHREPQIPYVFVHRVCGKGLLKGLQAGVDARTGERCVVPPKLGPLQEANGGLAVLFKEAIYPLKKCKALRRSIPCPNKPLETLIAMSHSGLSTSCIALPDTKGREDDPFTRQLASEGLNSEDVRILQDRAQDLERQGFQSMLPYFGNCSLETPQKNCADVRPEIGVSFVLRRFEDVGCGPRVRKCPSLPGRCLHSPHDLPSSRFRRPELSDEEGGGRPPLLGVFALQSGPTSPQAHTCRPGGGTWVVSGAFGQRLCL